jgi:sec-independent protein translocase protein TatA
MGTFSIWHWILVIAVVLLLFGRGKISELMGDVAKGIKSFKRGMAEDDVAEAKPPQRAIDHSAGDRTEAVQKPGETRPVG